MAGSYSSTLSCSWLIVLADGAWTGVLLRTTLSASGILRLLLDSRLPPTLELPGLAGVTTGVGRAFRASGSCWGERLGVAAWSPLPVVHPACRRPPAQQPPRRGQKGWRPPQVSSPLCRHLPCHRGHPPTGFSLEITISKIKLPPSACVHVASTAHTGRNHAASGNQRCCRHSGASMSALVSLRWCRRRVPHGKLGAYLALLLPRYWPSAARNEREGSLLRSPCAFLHNHERCHVAVAPSQVLLYCYQPPRPPLQGVALSRLCP